MLVKNGFEPILIKYYTKAFSLGYLLSKFGIKASNGLCRKIKLSLNTGDMFMVVARKRAIKCT